MLTTFMTVIVDKNDIHQLNFVNILDMLNSEILSQ